MSGLFEGQVGFAVGTGRCGTHFLERVLRCEPVVASSHERGALNETFHRYCSWYRLPVDHAGFLQVKESEIVEDLADHQFSFEASSYLSLSIPQLHQRFGAKFLLLVRSPDRVVNSFIRKDQNGGEPWYAEPFVYADTAKALGYQPYRFFHHFLARIAPVGEAFEGWNRMTQVGKLTWFWNAFNARILELFEDLPDDRWQVVKLEELDYDRYRELAGFLGFEPQLGRQSYDQLAAQRPGGLGGVATAASWTPQEALEFEKEVGPMAERFGYERSASRLAEAAPAPRQPRRGFRQVWNRYRERLRRGAIKALGGRP